MALPFKHWLYFFTVLANSSRTFRRRSVDVERAFRTRFFEFLKHRDIQQIIQMSRHNDGFSCCEFAKRMEGQLIRANRYHNTPAEIENREAR